jgi:hypothetical protein
VLRRLCLKVAGVCAALLAVAPICYAADGPRFESYITADYSGRAGGLASSTVWSAFGPLDQPGFRLKLDGFSSAYGDTNASMFSNAFMAADLNALADIMAGYQVQWDRLWIKFYGGAAYQRSTRIFWRYGRITPLEDYGAAAAVESFWRGAGRFWASADVSWLQIDNAACFYERVGYEAIRMEEGLIVSGGTEIGAILKRANEYRVGRRFDDTERFVKGGALLNIRYFSHELTVSAGLEKAGDEAEWRPYATLSYGRKF